MATDTARSWTDLDLLLATNSAGNISAQDLRDTIYSMRVFGTLYINNGSTQQNTATTYAAVASLSNSGIAVGVTEDASTSKLTVPCAGIYKLQCSVNFIGSVNATFTWAALKNGDATNATGTTAIVEMSATASKEESGHFEQIVSLAASDYLIFSVKADGSSKNVTVENATFSLERIA